MGNVKPLLVEQVRNGDALGAIDCYRFSDIRSYIQSQLLGTEPQSPSIEIGPSKVVGVYKEEEDTPDRPGGLWSVTVEIDDPSEIPDGVIPVQDVFELDLIPVSRLGNPNKPDSKDIIILTYDSTGQKHYCKAKNDNDQANLIATNPRSGG
jgi:hypothetical protein